MQKNGLLEMATSFTGSCYPCIVAPPNALCVAYHILLARMATFGDTTQGHTDRSVFDADVLGMWTVPMHCAPGKKAM